jgi:hypothetical protein
VTAFEPDDRQSSGYFVAFFAASFSKATDKGNRTSARHVQLSSKERSNRSWLSRSNRRLPYANERARRCSASRQILVAFAALGLATGWHFYGNLIEPHPTIVADPTKKIGPADGRSVNAATIDDLDKPADAVKR